jgi:C4-dicarboxylate-specific signal transduction histidine kinase
MPRVPKSPQSAQRVTPTPTPTRRDIAPEEDLSGLSSLSIADPASFESLLLTLSAAFVKAPSSEVEAQIDLWLGRLTHFIGVDRCTLLEFSGDGKTLHRRHYYSRHPATAFAVNLPAASFTWAVSQSVRGKVVAWERMPEDIPAEAVQERKYALIEGIKAALSVPVLTESSLYVLSLASFAGPRQWPETLAPRLQLIGAILASAVERARAERSVQSSEARNRALLRALPDLMFVISPEGVYLDFHAANQRDLMVEPSGFLGRRVDEVMPPELARMFQSAFRRASQSDRPVTLEYALPIQGEIRQFEARLVRREDGAIVSIVRNMSDTVRKRAEIERIRLELSHAERLAMLGHLTGSLAHELRQPISAVIGNAEAGRHLLDQGSSPDELRSTFEDIVNAGMRAGDVIERVMGLVRKEPRPLRPVDLNRLVQDVAKVVHSELVRHQVRLLLTLDPALPEVLGDSVQLQQVVLNVLLNGADAMTDSPPTDRELVLTTVSVGSKAQVSVRDRGKGVAPTDLRRIFEPFFSTKPNGTGMGLSISSEIIRAHGGEIWAENCETGGMILQFALPAAQTQRRRRATRADAQQP